MKILVINSGSSSLKYKVFDMVDESVLASGLVEKIGLEGYLQPVAYEPTDGEKIETEETLKNHRDALRHVLGQLSDPEIGVLDSLTDIRAVGHRVLHGKELFTESTLVGEKEVDLLKTLIEVGPLHMPANIMGIEACMALMPGVPQVTVFDTAFHQTMPASSYLYALPYEYYEQFGVRRYGFHGTSHRYLTQRTAELVGKQPEELNLITCHLGNGSSIAAVRAGKCFDTSMGFTPLEGLVMGTRCGNIDPAVIPFLGNKLELDWDELDTLMNKKSGLLGLSGVSSDMRDLAAARKNGNPRAQIAFDVFLHRLVQYVGAFYVELGGADVIVFSGGIGENDAEVRHLLCQRLAVIGVSIDEKLNSQVRSKEVKLSTGDSSIEVWVVPTDEELMIARDTLALAREAVQA
ncbi:MAG: acetate kinase [Firmicutes bacterium]|nr:acetate kinase [Bacillota bacterium]